MVNTVFYPGANPGGASGMPTPYLQKLIETDIEIFKIGKPIFMKLASEIIPQQN
jgi:hypothetical protein